MRKRFFYLINYRTYNITGDHRILLTEYNIYLQCSMLNIQIEQNKYLRNKFSKSFIYHIIAVEVTFRTNLDKNIYFMHGNFNQNTFLPLPNSSHPPQKIRRILT